MEEESVLWVKYEIDIQKFYSRSLKYKAIQKGSPSSHRSRCGGRTRLHAAQASGKTRLEAQVS